jgi:predicted metal-dependent hydrolase
LGRVTLVAPPHTRLEVVRAYVISKLGWIREQQIKLRNQARETPRQFIERESHYLWGQHYLLSVVEQDVKPCVTLDHHCIRLQVRPGSDQNKCAEVIHNWHKTLLHQVIPVFIRHWEEKLGVNVAGYFLQRMKTRWGSCNPRKSHIRLNTELVKKPKHLLEYVIVHEMIHLIEPTHNDRFLTILGAYYPHWREARTELNALPLTAPPFEKKSDEVNVNADI